MGPKMDIMWGENIILKNQDLLFSKFANQCNGDFFSNNIVFRQTGGIKILEMAQSNLLLYYEAEMPTEKQNSNCSKDNKLKLELKDQQNTQMWQFCLVKYKLSRLFWLKLTNWLEKKTTNPHQSRRPETTVNSQQSGIVQ